MKTKRRRSRRTDPRILATSLAFQAPAPGDREPLEDPEQLHEVTADPGCTEGKGEQEAVEDLARVRIAVCSRTAVCRYRLSREQGQRARRRQQAWGPSQHPLPGHESAKPSHRALARHLPRRSRNRAARRFDGALAAMQISSLGYSTGANRSWLNMRASFFARARMLFGSRTWATSAVRASI